MSEGNEQPEPSAQRASGGSRRANFVAYGFLALFVAALVVAALYVTRHEPDTAKVGDCVAQTGDNAVKVVACDDSAAQYKVVGRVESKSRIEASISACVKFEDLGVVKSYWQGKDDNDGFVLCLASAHS
jgi:hypothetical protein